MRILCIGISHKTATVALREPLSLDEAATGCALAELSRQWQPAEFAVLSTCNRTEIYTARPVHGHPREEELRSWLFRFCGVMADDYEDAVYTLIDADAIRHLFAVASGLDSLVVGEAQITGQVRSAYAAAQSAATAGRILNDLFQAALRVAKRVRSETALNEGAVSVASVAADCIAQALGEVAGACVLNIGAGKMNRLMLRRLVKLGASRILVANRSPQKAAALAKSVGGEAVEFEHLLEQLTLADAVVTSTAAEAPIITRRMLQRVRAARGDRPLVIMDIAVPRDVTADAAEIPGVRLFNIDDLERFVAASIPDRPEVADAAEAIVAEQLHQTLSRLKIRDVAPTIEALYNYMRQIADDELAAASNKLSVHDDREADRQVLTRALHRTIRRILHPAARNLRRAATAGGARADVAAIRKLFGLDDD